MPYCTQWFPMRSAERPSCGFARGARWAGTTLQIAVPSLTTPSPSAMPWTPTSTAARSHAGQGIRRTRAHLSRPPSCASLPHGLLIREAEARACLPSRPPSMPLVHSDDARPQELLGSKTRADQSGHLVISRSPSRAGPSSSSAATGAITALVNSSEGQGRRPGERDVSVDTSSYTFVDIWIYMSISG